MGVVEAETLERLPPALVAPATSMRSAAGYLRITDLATSAPGLEAAFFVPDRSGHRSALTRPRNRISLTAGQRGAICWLRGNNGKEVIQCLTSRWRVWLRRTRLWSRPPGSVDGAETSNHHEIRVRPPYVRFGAPRLRTRRFLC